MYLCNMPEKKSNNFKIIKREIQKELASQMILIEKMGKGKEGKSKAWIKVTKSLS